MEQTDPERSQALAAVPADAAHRSRIRRCRRVLPEVTRFGVSGAVAFLTEAGSFNVFLALGLGVALSSLLSAVVGTAVAYVGNRHWTYRERPFGRTGRRIALFCVVNVVGAGITTGCAVIGRDVLGLDGVVAANVAKNVVGMALAMVFRFWAYRTWVFPAESAPVAGGGLHPLWSTWKGAADAAGSWRIALRVAVPPWMVAHVLVAVAMGVARWCYGGLPDTGAVRPSSGLLVWDSGWYRLLAVQGYGPSGSTAVRFFPLLPLTVRGAAALTSVPATVVLLVLCSVCALVYGALLYVLVLEQTGDDLVARRSVWLSQLAPGSAVLVLGYSEGLASMLAAAFFLCLARGGKAGVVSAGVLSGLVRPTGVLLILPALLEFVRSRCRARRVPAVLGVVAPVAGTLVYLGWCTAAGHGWLSPYTAQTRVSLRGGVVVNPLADALHPRGGHLTLSGVAAAIANVLVLAVAAALLWVVGRRLPASWTAWSLAMVAAAASAAGFRSLPRYLAAVFPLLTATALVLHTRRRWCLALGACCVLFTVLAVMSFGGHYIP